MGVNSFYEGTYGVSGLKQIPQTCFLGLTPPHHFFLHLHPWFILNSTSPFNFKIEVYRLSLTFQNDITSVSGQSSMNSQNDLTAVSAQSSMNRLLPIITSTSAQSSMTHINIRPRFNDSVTLQLATVRLKSGDTVIVSWVYLGHILSFRLHDGPFDHLRA